MPPNLHPSAQSLADFLIGDCSPGQALLISKHLEQCPHCASRIQAMGAVGSGAGEISYGETLVLRPGLELTAVKGVSGLGEAVFYLRVAPGEALPLQTPLKIAELLVIEGRLAIDGKRCAAWDFLSLEAVPATSAVSDPEAGCACLLTVHDPDGLSA